MASRGGSSFGRPVKIGLLVFAIVALAFVALGIGYVAHLVRSFDTPEFKRSILDRASASVGTRIDARKVDISLLQGVTLEGVTIANPPPFTGNLVAADAFVLRYSLWSLLSGRLELARLSVEKPVLNLAMDARGVFNYEKLGGSTPTSPAPSTGALPIELVISKLSLKGARIVMRDPKAALLKVEGADLTSSIRLAGALVEGAGTLQIATVNLADSFFVRGVSAPLKASNGVMALAPVRAALAGGDVRGDVKVQLKNGFHFNSKLTLTGAQLQKLLEEAKAAQTASGTVTADATIEGSGGVATLKGKGQIQVKGCKVSHAPLMTLLATALRVPELAHPEFDECRTTFTLGGGRLVTPSISLKGPALQVTGHGVTNLDSLSIDYDMTLALGEALLKRVPAQELRAAFKDRGDGFSTLDFKVTGTTSAPQSDLTTRLGKAAAESGFKKLLHGKIF
jgi:hypothetical protein